MNNSILDSLREATVALASLPANSAQAKQLLSELMTNYDLVSRDEFDAQARLLAQSQARIEQLSQQLAQLEAAINAGAEGE
jgi:BMFP domain-containing protein YqiC